VQTYCNYLGEGTLTRHESAFLMIAKRLRFSKFKGPKGLKRPRIHSFEMANPIDHVMKNRIQMSLR